MPEAAPKGIHPLFLRGVTAEKYGFKVGDGIMDLVDHLYLKKEDILKEVGIGKADQTGFEECTAHQFVG